MHEHHGPWAARSSSRLIMLLSSERSGSTLLRVMLGEHSRIIAPQELFLMRYPDYDAWRAQKPVAMESLLEALLIAGQPISEAQITAVCRGRPITDVYQWLFEQLPSGAFLLDKTPAYTNESATLTRSAALRPFYVWLIRHPLGVIDSHVRLRRRSAGSALSASGHWIPCATRSSAGAAACRHWDASARRSGCSRT